MAKGVLENSISKKRGQTVQARVGVGTQKETKAGKATRTAELCTFDRCEIEWQKSHFPEGGCWAPESYLKGWFQYTDESVCSIPIIQSELLP